MLQLTVKNVGLRQWALFQEVGGGTIRLNEISPLPSKAEALEVARKKMKEAAIIELESLIAIGGRNRLGELCVFYSKKSGGGVSYYIMIDGQPTYLNRIISRILNLPLMVRGWEKVKIGAATPHSAVYESIKQLTFKTAFTTTEV